MVLLGLTLAAQAQKKQAGRAAKTPEEISTAVSTKMTTKYGLTDEQKAKIYQSTLTRTVKVREVRAKYPNAGTSQTDKKAMRQELKPLRDSYKSDLKEILTAEQYAQFEKDAAVKKEQMKTKGKTKQTSSPTDDVDSELGE